MASNPSSAASMPTSSNIPGLSQEILNLRRPLTTNTYYSCTQQESDNLCRQTLVPATNAKATTALVKRSKAGKIHETNEGQVAQVKCTACTKGGNGVGHPCYLSVTSTTKTCAHCGYTNKSKCDAQRAPAGSNNPAAGASSATVKQPAVVAPVGPPPGSAVAPATAPLPVARPAVIDSASTQHPPHPLVQSHTHRNARPSASGTTNNAYQGPIDRILLPLPSSMTAGELEVMINNAMNQRTDILRRDQGEDQR